jgi:protease-4
MNFARESIFVSALRSFCGSIAVIIGLAFGFLIVGIGMMTMMGPTFVPEHAEPMIMPDAYGERVLLPGNTPAILRIDIHGVIGMGDLTTEKFTDILADSREMMLKDSRVKAILLHMDTPGGTVVDSDGIYRALLDYKQKYNVPIYAYIDGLCASGGMYISSAADKLFATNPSVIGSVGTIMGPTFNFAELMSKIGVSSLTMTAGKDKDALNPFRTWQPGEDTSYMKIIDAMYAQFVSIVTSARTRLDPEKLKNEYGAHVFIAKEAENLGYIDVADSNYAAALNELAMAAGLKEDEKYQVVQLQIPRSFLSGLGDSLLMKREVKHSFDVGSHMHPELSGKLLYLYTP